MKQDNLKLSVLSPAGTIRDFLTSLPAVTRAWLKRNQMPAKLLNAQAHEKKEITVPIDVLNRSMINPSYLGGEVRFIGKESGIFAYSKPPGISCYPLRYSASDNLLSSIRMQGDPNSLLSFNEGEAQRGLLNRIDRVTSGIVLLTNKQDRFDEVFNNRSKVLKNKYYVAITKKVPWEKKVIKSYLENTKSGAVKIIERKDPNSLIVVKSIMTNEDLSLLLIKLREGHRHQIRAQLASEGYPILGDELYGGEESDRVFLHSYLYELSLGGKDFVFEDAELKTFDLFFDHDSSLNMIRNNLGVI